ncbi:hypothetical protein BLNAU_14127 [Blattamonas nauphoetae]|uniref:TmcB/TmcC TPR repeats domain-containing protein n=1 Tax=Blattamonas nauphoetae TaxID=2049346 RepID=A0ABQ9XK07_9EUKA|nr:hypothetical protein BLNAU_14127 [Blattamonas nauphoetae]
MAQKSDDTKSVSRSVSSMSDATSGLTLIRFNPVDDILFSTLYTLHTTPQMSNFFYFVWLALTIFQLGGIAVVWGNFPFHEKIITVGHGIFQYLDFSISWSHEVFLFTMTILLTLFALTTVILIIISTVLIKTDRTVPDKLASLVQMCGMLCAYPFFIPALNVFLGGIHCKTSPGHVGMSCESPFAMVSLIFGAIMVVLHVFFSFLIRFFVFPFNARKGGMFASQSGLFMTLCLVESTALPLLTLFLKDYAQYLCIAGFAMSAGLALYATFLLPFHNANANALVGAVQCAIASFHLFGTIWSFLGTGVTWLNAVLWVCWGLSFVGFPILAFVGIRKYGRSKWAIRPGEPIPVTHKKKAEQKPFVFTASPSVTQTHAIPQPAASTLGKTKPASPAPTLNTLHTHKSKTAEEMSILPPSSSRALPPINAPPIIINPTNVSVNGDDKPNEQSPTSSEEQENSNSLLLTPRASSPQQLAPIIIPPATNTPRIAPVLASSSPQPAVKPLTRVTTQPPISLQPPPIAAPPSPRPLVSANYSAAPKYLSEQLGPKLPKYPSPNQVMEAIKFMTCKELRKTKECVYVAEDILRAAEKKFPTSSEMWMTSSFYTLSYTSSEMKLGDQLRTTMQCVPSIHERWVVYALMRDMERKRSAAGGTNSLGVTFKLNFAKASKSHELACAYLQQAYLLLSKENMDLHRVMLMMDKAIMYEKEAREGYRSLLKQYPASPQVLRGLGALMRDIFREDDAAILLFTEANLVEEDDTQQQQDNTSLMSGGSRLSNVAGVGGGNDKKKKKKKRHGRAGNFQEFEEETKNLLPVFVPGLMICAALEIGTLIFLFIYNESTYTTCSVTARQITAFSGMIAEVLDLCLFSTFYLLRQNNPDSYFITHGIKFVPELDLITDFFEHFQEELGTDLHQIYVQSNGDNEFRVFEDEAITALMPYYGNYTVGTHTVQRIVGSDLTTLNLIDLLNNFANVAEQMKNISLWKPDLWLGQRALLWYVRLNGPVVASEWMKNACFVCAENSSVASKSVRVTTITSGIVSVLVPAILLIVQTYVTYLKLTRGRSEVFFRIVNARKEDVLRLKKRLDETEIGQDDESLSATFTNTSAVSVGSVDDENNMEADLGPDSDDREKKEDKDDRLRRELIGMGVREEMINMMWIQGMTMEQIHMMLAQGGGVNGEEMGEVEEEMLNEEEEAKKEEEDKKGEDEKDKKKKKKKSDLSHLSPKEQELMIRVRKVKSFIPNSWYVRVVIGMMLIVILPTVFYVVAVIATRNSISYYESVILTAYKSVVAEQITILALGLSHSLNYEVPNLETRITYATGPWEDFRHLGSNPVAIQVLLAELVTYYEAIDILVSQGSESSNVIPTGDERFDGRTVTRTVRENSKTNTILYATRDCFQNHEGDCDIPDRIYGQSGNYTGLVALSTKMLEAARRLAGEEDPFRNILPETEAVQVLCTLMVYDLRGGYQALLDAVVEEMDAGINVYNIWLYVLFVFAMLSAVTGLFGVILPTRSTMVGIADATEKMKELDPESDAADRTGMGQASWREEYTCDCIRLDKQHQTILLTLAAVCGVLDPTMEVQHLVAELKETVNDQARDELEHSLTILQQKEDHQPKQQEATRKRERRKALMNMMSFLIRTTFNAFSDEEALIDRYRVEKGHRRAHLRSHCTLLRKLQKATLQLAKGAKKDEALATSHAQNLIQLYTQWLTEHVTKIDRELSALLAGNVPESEMEKEVEVVTDFTVPRSFNDFLESENASMQDQKLFEKMKHVLGIH